MSFYSNVGSMREGEMFLSEDNKVLQVFKKGKLSVIEPPQDNEDNCGLGRYGIGTGLWSLHIDQINSVSYVWDSKSRLWLSFKLKEHDMDTQSRVYNDFSSLYPNIITYKDSFDNIGFDFETQGLK